MSVFNSPHSRRAPTRPDNHTTHGQSHGLLMLTITKTTLLKMQSTIAFFFAFQFFVQLASSQVYKCYARVYGRPTIPDCAIAINEMPDASSRAPTPRLSDPRFFIEPQYLVPPFKRVSTEDNVEIEQLPKFWRHSQLNYSYQDPTNCKRLTPE